MNTLENATQQQEAASNTAGDLKMDETALTKDQALDMAITLRKQGKTYPYIENILKEKGYRSDRTGKPVSHLTVRHMVETAIGEERKERKREAQDEIKMAIGDEEQALIAAQKIMNMPELKRGMKVKFVQAIMSEIERGHSNGNGKGNGKRSD